MKTAAILRALTMIGLVASASSLSAQTPDITIITEAAMAPNAFGSPSYAAWSANGIFAVENDLTSYGSGPAQFSVDNIVLPIADNIVTGYPSWMGQADPSGAYAGEYGNRASFVTVINGNGSLINIANMGFVGASSDSGNALGFAFPAGSWSGYDAGDIGIIFDNGVNTLGGYTTVTSGDQNVNEIISIGAGNAYASYTFAEGGDDPNPLATDQQILNYDAGQIAAYTGGGYDFTGTFTYGSASGAATAVFAPDVFSTWALLGGSFAALAGLRRRLNRA
jgi:hypothetical protein